MARGDGRGLEVSCGVWGLRAPAHTPAPGASPRLGASSAPLPAAGAGGAEPWGAPGAIAGEAAPGSPGRPGKAHTAVEPRARVYACPEGWRRCERGCTRAQPGTLEPSTLNVCSAPAELGGQGPAPSAHLAIQPIPCNKRQHLTELRTSPSLLLLRHRPALPRLRLLLALLPVLGPCQRAQPQAGLQEAGLSFKEQRAAAKKPPPSTLHLQPGCRSWATKTQPQGRRVDGGGGGRPEEAPGQNCREQPRAALGGGRPHSSFTNLPAPTARAAGQFFPFCCKAGTRMQQPPEPNPHQAAR